MPGELPHSISASTGSLHAEFAPARRRPIHGLWRLPAVLLLSSCCPALGDLSFVAIGDWGGESSEAPSTASQLATASGFVATVRALKADFALMMGDNIYQHGVMTDAQAFHRFQETFEAVYPRYLPGTPFYALAGNHDYGEGEAANVSAQVAYSKVSQSWRFPSLWYKVHREFEAGGRRTLDLLVIDTVSLCGMDAVGDVNIDAQLEFLGQAAYARQPGRLRREVAEVQWSWLQRELAASSADYLWVSGHFPIWSIGLDGSNPCLEERLRPMLLRHGAHYISGHDHNLEHLSSGGLDAFVVGAGKECCYSPLSLHTVPPGAARFYVAGHEGSESWPALPFPVVGGFASLSFGAETSVVTLHAHNGTALYRAPPLSRRSLGLRVVARVTHEPLQKPSGSGLEFTVWSPLVAASLAMSALATALFTAALFVGKWRGTMASNLPFRTPSGMWSRSVQQPDALG
mmetsp:Transcript_55847/g.120758  ORF Transcript_55847/g.120758 Transcript_55847/m.120758 type:complete len:460 (-) Transcript_55847:151-1530(-)